MPTIAHSLIWSRRSALIRRRSMGPVARNRSYSTLLWARQTRDCKTNTGSGFDGDWPCRRPVPRDTISARMHDRYSVLKEAERRSQAYLRQLPDRPVRALATPADLRARLGGTLGRESTADEIVLATLADAADVGTTASRGPRFFGFVIGGSLPIATAADWLVSAWDQNAAVHVLSPFASAIEDIAASWLREVVCLPREWSVGFVTGCQMANFTAL